MFGYRSSLTPASYEVKELHQQDVSKRRGIQKRVFKKICENCEEPYEGTRNSKWCKDCRPTMYRRSRYTCKRKGTVEVCPDCKKEYYVSHGNMHRCPKCAEFKDVKKRGVKCWGSEFICEICGTIGKRTGTKQRFCKEPCKSDGRLIQCRVCKEYKPYEQFYDGRGHDGGRFVAKCDQCVRDTQNERNRKKALLKVLNKPLI